METLNLENTISTLERNDVSFAGVFGSFAKNQANETSDIDILVRFKKSKSFFRITGLEIELSKILGKKVDLVTERTPCPHIKDTVLETLKPFYGKR